MFKSRVTLTGLMGLRLTEDHTGCGLVAETQVTPREKQWASGRVCSRGSVGGRVRWEEEGECGLGE